MPHLGFVDKKLNEFYGFSQSVIDIIFHFGQRNQLTVLDDDD